MEQKPTLPANDEATAAGAPAVAFGHFPRAVELGDVGPFRAYITAGDMQFCGIGASYAEALSRASAHWDDAARAQE
jgi:hypothetical protein